MITFFTILFVIIGVNAIMLFISSNTVGRKRKTTDGRAETSASKIYPIDLISSKYKKAV
ncbi:hypothetical protein [Maribacter sp. 2307UL18-2]|uniref:hypothetical protein n=1 Tax=Maribacter sp. 2307UL18-2 TaxID=3386274 RepID=UPI0039BC4258